MQIKNRDLELKLNLARNSAKEGLVKTTLIYLDEAKRYANKIGMEIPKKIVFEIENTALRKGIESALSFAELKANEGSINKERIFEILNYLSEAKEYAARIGVDISDRVRKIEEMLKK